MDDAAVVVVVAPAVVVSDDPAEEDVKMYYNFRFNIANKDRRFYGSVTMCPLWCIMSYLSIMSKRESWIMIGKMT